MDEVTKLKYEAAKAECEKHSARINFALHALGKKMPLSEVSFKTLDDESVALLDQFLYRFTKMQDAIGTRLLPAAYRLLTQDDTVRPFIDVLNHLEKLRVLPSVDQWQNFRNARNAIAHEYPERESESVAAINYLYNNWNAFEAMYQHIIHKTDTALQGVKL